jgi:putative oxidoreductase
MKTNIYLVAGGILSMIASLLHIAIIIGGPDWYRFFGAGEGMAQLAEGGSSYPRLIGGLPLLKVVLGLISAIYVVRGVLGIPMVIYLDSSYLKELESEMTFMIVSSIISLIIGLFYSMGLIQLLQSKK